MMNTLKFDSFCSTRLSSATQFALSVSLQHLSIFIDARDQNLTFRIYSLHKTGLLINSEISGQHPSSPSNENKSRNAKSGAETGILQELARTGTCMQMSRTIWIRDCALALF